MLTAPTKWLQWTKRTQVVDELKTLVYMALHGNIYLPKI
jgi:hypothetical protein